MPEQTKILITSDAGKRIKHIRKEYGLSQAEFGVRLGLSASSISEIESGKTNASQSLLLAIEHLYGIRFYWLLFGGSDKYLREDDKYPLYPPPDKPYKNVSEPDVLEASKRLDKAVQEDTIYNVRESKALSLAEPPGPAYGQPPELARLQAQVRRIYKGSDEKIIERLKGFLAALDPGNGE